ncbi:uncharacterized protein LOC130917790 isoform X2 [Corythoichthys intestinalis]|uniref:uncharacterized protein LOC130917790 isoform X2 n=1 Tax=Corythoichthys intestinalis TaxID=161448 RepID=UPI0025A5102B|nr:uncharacterized protein LOC130917790 isoform X2 [Corythoichthys intestinalis]
MAGPAFCPKNPKHINRDEQNFPEGFQEFSKCLSCNKNNDETMILPCSHTMCVQCISTEGEKRSGQSIRYDPKTRGCSVLCPLCLYDVELPCRSWSSAVSCLPKYPTIKFECVSQVTGRHEGASEPNHPPRFLQGDFCTVAAFEETEQCLHFALDPVTAPPSLHLSNSCLTVTYQEAIPLGPLPNNVRRLMTTSDPRVMDYLPQVCADVVIAQGQYYWEVEVCNSSLYKIGVTSLDGQEGWWLERQGFSFCTVYDGRKELLNTVPPQIKTIGLFLNFGGGALSFHNPVTQEHLVTLPTHFNPSGVLPTLGLGQGWLKLRCGLPPPLYVFLSKNSAYRGPCGPSRGLWQRDIPFQSVRKFIQKFEELSASNLALNPSFGSSSS